MDITTLDIPSLSTYYITTLDRYSILINILYNHIRPLFHPYQRIINHIRPLFHPYQRIIH